MKRVLFVCVHNAGRSQMARAYLRALSDGRVHAESAGTEPASQVNPVVVEAMKEKGIDVSEEQPRLLTQDMADAADRIITMGCSVQDACPAVFMPTEDWALEDPQGKSLDDVRRIRDDIERRVRDLIADLTTGGDGL